MYKDFTAAKSQMLKHLSHAMYNAHGWLMK